MSPFDFINSINRSKPDMMKDDPSCEKEYNAFIVNRAFSYFPDTIEHAQNMNMYPNLPSRLQYDYMRKAIKPRNRFTKWAKKTSTDDVDFLKKHFSINQNRAEEARRLITDEQMKMIRERYDNDQPKRVSKDKA
jgi:hypothetical protein